MPANPLSLHGPRGVLSLSVLTLNPHFRSFQSSDLEILGHLGKNIVDTKIHWPFESLLAQRTLVCVAGLPESTQTGFVPAGYGVSKDILGKGRFVFLFPSHQASSAFAGMKRLIFPCRRTSHTPVFRSKVLSAVDQETGRSESSACVASHR